MIETRNRWPKGIVRHLRIDDDCPPGEMHAIRAEHNGGLGAPGGSVDIFYTLVVHPKHRDRAEALRRQLEESSVLGGPFSPERDI